MIRYIIILILFSIELSCANIQMPTGGAKDTEAPKIKRSNVGLESTNVDVNSIKLKFNEFVELNNPQKNIIVSPPNIKLEKTKIVGKQVTLVFDQPFAENKTYNIQLTNAIKDFKEGNLLKNYNIVFSTGSSIDTSNLNISNFSTLNQPFSSFTKTVLVQNKEDFINENYSYMTIAENGISNFNNVDNGIYYAYSFIDSNQNSIWDKTEVVGYIDSQLNKNSQNLVTNLFLPEYENKVYISNATHGQATVFSLNTIQTLSTKYNYEKIDDHNIMLYTDDNNLSVFLNNKNYDLEVKNRDEKSFKLLNTKDRLKIYDYMNAVVEFNQVIDSIYTEKISLNKSDTSFYIPEYKIKDNKLIFSNLEPKTLYKALIQKGAIKFGDNFNEEEIKLNISTIDTTSIFENIFLKYNTDLPKNHIVRIQNPKAIDSFEYTESGININRCHTNKILVEIFVDENENGLWDSGDVYSRRQPEKIKQVTISLINTEKEYTLNISL